MQQLLNYRMRIIIQDNREMIGQLMAFDKHMNIVLADCEEFRRVGGKGKKEEKIVKRSLGLTVLRGEIIVSMSIEGPPPPEVSYSFHCNDFVGAQSQRRCCWHRRTRHSQSGRKRSCGSSCRRKSSHWFSSPSKGIRWPPTRNDDAQRRRTPSWLCVALF